LDQAIKSLPVPSERIQFTLKNEGKLMDQKDVADRKVWQSMIFQLLQSAQLTLTLLSASSRCFSATLLQATGFFTPSLLRHPTKAKLTIQSVLQEKTTL
jgi:hypothetical protein